LTCHRGAGEYWSASRLGLLVGSRWMSQLQDRSADGGGALSETFAMVSLSTVPGLSLL